MNRHTWENMRPWHRRPEHGERPYDHGRYREQDRPSADRPERYGHERQPDYYGYEAHEQPHYGAPPSYANNARGNYPPGHSQTDYARADSYAHETGSGARYGRGDNRQDDQRWRQPLYSDVGNHDSEGYQYFGGGRQNYAGVESGAGSMAMEHYLPQGSSAAFYDWDRSLWGGREPDVGVGPDYYGRGPRDYERSDERVREDICERLCDDRFVDPSDMTVEVHAGVVTLEGTVEDRPQKYRIEDIVDSCRGVKEVQNRLAISQRPSEAALGEWSEDQARKH